MSKKTAFKPKKTAVKLKKGTKQGQYLAESKSTKGKFYIVDIDKGSCSCPQWLFRLVKTGGKCKHISAVEEKYKLKVKERSSVQKTTEKKPKTKIAETKKSKIIKFVKTNPNIGIIGLIDKFGDKEVDALIEQGDLLEENGKVRVLE